MATVRFARLSFETKLTHYADPRDGIDRRREALLEVIDYHTDINRLLLDTEWSSLRKRGDWGFGDISSNETVIQGKVGKKKEEINRIRDDEKEGFIEEEKEDNDVAFFVIDLEVGVMAYVYRRNVGKKAPYRIIEAIFNSYHDGNEKLEFSPLIDKKEIEEDLNAFSKITEINFVNLHPTNPNSTNHSRNMDEFLREGEIEELTLRAEGKEGIRLKETPLLDSGLGLAEEGYGSATIEGEKENGEEARLSTDKRAISSDVEIGERDERNEEKLLNEIQVALSRLEGQINNVR